MRDAAPLPTFSVLGISQAPENIDATKVASEWLASFAKAMSSGNLNATLALFIDTCYWRDLLAFTWNFRSFDGKARIKDMLKERLDTTKPDKFSILVDQLHGVQNVAPDLLWVQSSFLFETDIGQCSGVVRLVPTPFGAWKCHCLFTNLEGLKGFPEKLGQHRHSLPNHGTWLSMRQEELEFRDQDPPVLIIGGGQNGLSVAARLRYLGVQSVVIEKNARVGDNWRSRYDALCLHDPVGCDHLAYMPFPPTWPTFTPSLKFANWLENYAESMELNVWTSSEVLSARPDASNKWNVVVRRDGVERTLRVGHVIFASGLGGGICKIPELPGRDKFKGKVLHAMKHGKATDYAGKKVVIVGAGTSAHDVASDCVHHGIDVTMYQRSPTYVMSNQNGIKVLKEGLYGENGPPTDVADRLSASFARMMAVPMFQASTKKIADMDKDLLEGLSRVGFKLNMGINGTGVTLLAAHRSGGFYPDVGASQYIIDGKIKLKSDSLLRSYTETGLEFEDGSRLDADVVIFATGFGKASDYLRTICGDEVADTTKPIWGLDDEGEIKGCWRDLGHPGLWFMMGTLNLVRFHGKHVALQIKAMEEGLFGTRYNS